MVGGGEGVPVQQKFCSHSSVEERPVQCRLRTSRPISSLPKVTLMVGKLWITQKLLLETLEDLEEVTTSISVARWLSNSGLDIAGLEEVSVNLNPHKVGGPSWRTAPIWLSNHDSRNAYRLSLVGALLIWPV